MKAQMEKRIQELEGQVETLKKMMAALEDGRTKPKSRPVRSIQQAMSKPLAFALMVVAAFLVLGGNLHSQQTSDDALFIDPSGHVGIGTTHPNRTFEIERQDADTEFSINERLFLDGSAGTVRITNNAYMQNGQWAIKDPAKKAVSLAMHDSGMLEIYGTRTAGKTDWQKLATFDASSDRVDFPSGSVKVKSLQIGNTIIGERELLILKKLVAGQLAVDLYNLKQSEYLYAADYKPFDKDRRRVFTWRKKNQRVNQGRWKLVSPN